MKIKGMFRYVCLCALVMASGRVMAAEAQGVRPAGRKDPNVKMKKMLGKPIKSFCGYEFGSPLVTKKKESDPLVFAKPKSRYRKFTRCLLNYDQKIGLWDITAFADLGKDQKKVKAEALAVMKDFTTKYGAVFEKGEPSDRPEGFKVEGWIPVSENLSFSYVKIDSRGHGDLDVEIMDILRHRGKVSGKLTDAEIAQLRVSEEKKRQERDELIRKMKAFVVPKFEMRPPKTIRDFSFFVRCVLRGSGVYFGVVCSGNVPTIDMAVENMTLFDIFEKIVKDGKGKYCILGDTAVVQFP